jgi:predicted ATPase/DNA-binding SARP family transcriptional activator
VSELHIFGGMSWWVDGRDQPLGGPRERALLALLVVSRDQPLSTDRLADGLWGEAVPPTAHKAVQVYISRLRRKLGSDVIERLPAGYRLRVDDVVVDLVRFEDMLSEGLANLAADDPIRAEAAFDAATSIADGDPFADVADLEALRPEIERIDELRWQAAEGRFEAALRNGRHEAVLSQIQRGVDARPHRERLWYQLMLALYRSGRQVDALAAYHQAREALDVELGIEPGPDLQTLEGRILRQDDELRAPAPRRNLSLPTPVSSFIGREAELGALCALIDAHRVVTVQGPGGVGKTRLAVEAAKQAAGRFEDGVFFVALAELTVVELVAAEILATLGVRPPATRAPLDVLAGHLSDKRVLLVLDNLEQLPEAGREIAGLLERAPTVHVLATSRAPLRIRGERLFELETLAVDGPGRLRGEASPAALLFLERAAEMRPGTSSSSDSAAIETICSRVDGLPLAIELLARLTRVMSPAEIAESLAGGGLEMDATMADLPEHQSSLMQAIRWSRALLPGPAREVFPIIGIFAGGFDRPAFETVRAATSLGAMGDASLAAMVDQSLIRRTEPRGGQSRFGTLETVRVAALDMLRTTPDLETRARKAYLDYFVELAEWSERGLVGRDQAAIAERLEADLDNLRAALQAACDGRLGEPALRAAAALRPFWERRGRFLEGRRWLDLALTLAADVPPIVAGKAENAAGVMAQLASDLPMARRHWEAALAIREAIGDTDGATETIGNLGVVAFWSHDFARAEELFAQSLAAAREIGDAWRVGAHEVNLGNLFLVQGDLDAADRHLLAAEAQFLKLDDARRVATALSARGLALTARGQLDEATVVLDRALKIAEETGSWDSMVEAHRGLARIAVDRGTIPEALDHLRPSMALTVEAGDPIDLAETLEVLAEALAASAEWTAASQALGAAGRIRAELGMPPWPLYAGVVEGLHEAAGVALGTSAFRTALARGEEEDPRAIVHEILGVDSH